MAEQPTPSSHSVETLGLEAVGCQSLPDEAHPPFPLVNDVFEGGNGCGVMFDRRLEQLGLVVKNRYFRRRGAWIDNKYSHGRTPPPKTISGRSKKGTTTGEAL